MSLQDVEGTFPALKADGYEKTSEETERYNCFAFATSEADKWVDPTGLFGAFWPPDILPTKFLTSFIEYFRSKGFSVCENGNPEEGFEKIALYKNDFEEATHAARLLPSGLWISKLGPWEDITHIKLESLEGYYGKIAKFMKRPLPK